MFATTPNLVLVIGVTSDEAAAVVPIINAQHMVVFAMTGQSEFDHTKFPYFYRLVPPDLIEAYALSAIAHNYEHFTKIALAFGNDIGSQTFVAPAIAAIHKHTWTSWRTKRSTCRRRRFAPRPKRSCRLTRR